MLDFVQIRPDLLMPDGSSQSDTPDSWSRRSSLKLEEVSWRLDLGSYPFLSFIFCSLEVDEANEEMIEVEAAKVILEGETR